MSGKCLGMSDMWFLPTCKTTVKTGDEMDETQSGAKCNQIDTAKDEIIAC